MTWDCVSAAPTANHSQQTVTVSKPLQSFPKDELLTAAGVLFAPRSQPLHGIVCSLYVWEKKYVILNVTCVKL